MAVTLTGGDDCDGGADGVGSNGDVTTLAEAVVVVVAMVMLWW